MLVCLRPSDGNNALGQLGDGWELNSFRPVEVGGDLTWSTVSVGTYHVCGIDTQDRGSTRPTDRASAPSRVASSRGAPLSVGARIASASSAQLRRPRAERVTFRARTFPHRSPEATRSSRSPWASSSRAGPDHGEGDPMLGRQGAGPARGRYADHTGHTGTYRVLMRPRGRRWAAGRS